MGRQTGHGATRRAARRTSGEASSGLGFLSPENRGHSCKYWASDPPGSPAVFILGASQPSWLHRRHESQTNKPTDLPTPARLPQVLKQVLRLLSEGKETCPKRRVIPLTPMSSRQPRGKFPRLQGRTVWGGQQALGRKELSLLFDGEQRKKRRCKILKSHLAFFPPRECKG